MAKSCLTNQACLCCLLIVVLLQIPSSLSRAPFTLVDLSFSPPEKYQMAFLAGPASVVQVRRGKRGRGSCCK
jgi:hypothetical protein